MNKPLKKSITVKVQALYHGDGAVKALLDVLSTSTQERSEIAADRASVVTGISYYEMVAAMKALEAAAAGTFIPGRRGKKSRFQWAYSPRSLAAAARGEGEPYELDDEALPEADGSDRDFAGGRSPEEPGDAVHEFLLRSDRKVRLSLPQNLTSREADRLAAFIRALPFAEERD